ncbi:hypothetical protein SBRCBS47491_007299 [Sporothrix bragantina]|uniref:Uncharacterized protein n=1 Tax=Sporothrix bragantina TaxID=671064 RepID=A0ABP0CC26_9PEZI
MTSGLTDEAVLEGHDLIDGAEHEAAADPKDFKKVHSVGETGGSILPDPKQGATSSAGSGGNNKGSVMDTVESKVNDLKDKVLG